MRFFVSMLTGLAAALSLAPNAHAQEPMPDFIAGQSFETVAMQVDGQTWYATLDFAEAINPDTPSTIDIPSLECASNLFAVDHDENRVLFKQRLTEGQGRCLDGGYIEVAYNAAARLPVFEHAALRVMAPVYTGGLLVPRGETRGDEAVLLEWTERIVDPRETPPLTGYWGDIPGVSSDWSHGRSCMIAMTDESIGWLPANTQGRLVIWATPSESGGRIYLAWVNNQGEGGLTNMFSPVSEDQIGVIELNHFRENMFVAPDGFGEFEGRTILYARKREGSGRAELVIVSTEQEPERITRLGQCPPLPASSQDG